MPEEGFCLDQSLVDRLQEFAEHEGLAPQEAFEIALGLGLETALGERAKRDAEIEGLSKRVEDVLGIASLLGPPLLGVLRLLVAWAAREGFGVSEDELLAEILSTCREEWELRLAQHGIVSPSGEAEA